MNREVVVQVMDRSFRRGTTSWYRRSTTPGSYRSSNQKGKAYIPGTSGSVVISPQLLSFAPPLPGFLKISVAIMGPNDECPGLKVSGNAGEEDVESNLLFPAGLRLSPAAFQLNVFQAEDLPRSESAGRVEFGGTCWRGVLRGMSSTGSALRHFEASGECIF